MTVASETAAANRRHARVVAASLAAGGVQRVVASPGSRSTPLVLAIADEPRLQTEVVLDERAAGFYALGLARASGAPVALVCTSGSAAAHYIPAAIEASESGVPLVILSADRPPEAQHSGDWQTIDQHRLIGRALRRYEDLGAPTPELPLRRTSQAVARVLDAATQAPAGPVQLNCPFRKPLWEEAPDEGRLDELRPARCHRPLPFVDAGLAQMLLRRMLKARRGVLCVGALPGPPELQPRLAEDLTRLAEALGWPLIAEAASPLRFGLHPRDGVICAADGLLRDPLIRAQLAPELVLRFGPTSCSKPLISWLGEVEALWLVDAAGRWADPSWAAAELIAADPSALLEALLHQLEHWLEDRPAPVAEGWREAWTHAEAAAQAAIAEACEADDWEGAVARALAAALPVGAGLHVANSMPVRELEAFAASRAAPLRVFVSRGANGIDGTIATALGEAEAQGQRFALLIGDLATIHDLGGLALLAERAAQLPAGFDLVIVDNGGGGIFERLPIAGHAEHFERFFLTPSPHDLGALAAALGLPFGELAGARAVAEALAGEEPGARVWRVRIDRGTNLARHSHAQRLIAERARAALEEE